MKLQAAYSSYSANNLDATKDFYVRILGLDLASEEMGLHFRLPFGGMLFIYHKIDHKPATFTVLNLVVEDLEAAVDELLTNDIIFEKYPGLIPNAEQDPKGIFWTNDPMVDGPSIAWFKDPSGNIIALQQAAETTAA